MKLLLGSSLARSLLDPARRLLQNYVPAATIKIFDIPTNYNDIEIPEKPKLKFLDKVPQFPPGTRAPRMQKKIIFMRGPELVHTELIHKQYGIIALHGGRLRHGHLEMIRMTLGRRMDASRMFAVWRVDAPWQPVTRKGQGKRMGGGKGSIDHYVTPIKAGRVIVELGGKCQFEEVKKMLTEVAWKLPFKARVVSQEIMEERKAEVERIARENLNPYTYEYIVKNNIQGCRNWMSPYDKKWFGRFI